MTANIHPTAIIDPAAQIGPDCEIGPFCILGPNVRLEARVTLDSNVRLEGRTHLCEDVKVHHGCVLGGAPQSIGFKDDGTSRLTVGAGTILRESVTISTGIPAFGGHTQIGAECFLMALTHVGHDSIIGDKCVIANGTQIAGHVEIGEQSWIGGNTLIHQFQKIGAHVMTAAGTVVLGDIPHYAIAAGNPATLGGLNVRGLKRRGFTRQRLQDLRKIYQDIYHGEGVFNSRLERAQSRLSEGDYGADVAHFLSFFDGPRKRSLAHAS